MSRNIKFTGDIDDLDAQLFQLEDINKQTGDGKRPQSRQKPQTSTEPGRPHSPVLKKERKHDHDDENLGEDFESTPWIPPSIEKANKFKRDHIFRNGDARIDSVDIIHASDVAVGVSLYFQFAMSMAICLMIMSILCLPELIFVYNGSAIAAEDQDAFGLYRYTLGNIGYDPQSSTYAKDSKCVSNSYAANETCIHFNGYEVSLSDAANVITAMEFLQIVVFFFTAFHIYRKALSVTGRNAKAEASVADYSIMITNIPPDTKDIEIITHFNRLYQLGEPDWKGRPSLEGAEPVSDVGNTGDTRFQGTWIAECILHKGIGDFISSFKSKQHIMERMYRCRARMKMYAENSPHAHGHNLSLYLKAEQQMIATGALIDKLTEHNVKRSGLKIIPDTDTSDYGQSVLARIANPHSIYYNIDAPSVAVFVIFQYGESMARCLDDYQRYSTFPMSLFYPQELKFRGHKIIVSKAPEPDQIVWEHIEVSGTEKFGLRVRTMIITTILVVLCFIIILQASIYKQFFSDSIPQLSLCNTVVPEVYINGTSKGYRASEVELIRPSSSLQSTFDYECSSKLSGTFYATYVLESDNNRLVANYSLDVCSTEGICPSAKYKTFCPCVSTTSKTTCESRGCDYPAVGTTCESYKAGVIGACYCYQKLLSLLNSGVVNALNSLSGLQSSDCGEFYSSYSLASALTYISVIATTGVNVLMREFLKMLAKHEAHTSLDEYQGSIMSKIFLSNFATMSILVLVAYGNAQSDNSFLQTLHIFTGPYVDFTQDWYGSVGFYLMTTFILQSFSPLVYNLFMHLIGKPILRLYHHSRIRQLKSHSIVTQHDLNMLEVGKVFDSTDHMAQLLTLLFFAMMFAPGLPLLMPLCCFAFVLYFRVDKHLLCRYYQKPPNVGDAAVRVALMYLPYAAVIRLAFGCWMLGNRDILRTMKTSSNAAYFDFLESAKQYSGGNAAINAKIFQSNTFPLFILFLFLCVVLLVVTAWKHLPIYWIYKIIHAIMVHSGKKVEQVFTGTTENNTISTWDLLRLDDPLRQQSSAFTGEFYRLIKHKDEIPDTCYKMFAYAYLTALSEVELEEGYKTQDRGDFVVKIKVWMQYDQRKIDGTRSKHGEHKKTYEVIADHRCYSYDIEKVPDYKVAIQGLREGTQSILDYMEQHGAHDAISGRNLLFEKAGIASHIIADYEKRKKGRNVAAEGMDFFDEIDDANKLPSRHLTNYDNIDDDEENGAIVSKTKKKPEPRSHSSGGGYVAIDAEETPKTDPATTNRSGSNHMYPVSKGNNRNFTFDDFNFDVTADPASQVNNSHNNTSNNQQTVAEDDEEADKTPTRTEEKEKKEHSKHHHSHHGEKKKKKKHKQDRHDSEV